MGVKLVSASAGSVEIVAPTTASNYTATMPAGTGNVVVNGINSSIVSGTSQASTSGTSIDFTSIPSWVKRITVMLNNVSTSGTSNVLIQIGSGSVSTSGYASSVSFSGATTGGGTSTAGLIISVSATAANQMSGATYISLFGSNTYIATGNAIYDSVTPSAFVMISSGIKTSLGGALDRVRVTTVNGTDTFDAGSINILYE